MTAYWLMFLIPTLVVLSPFRATPQLNRLAWLVVGVLLLYMIGLRHEVGGDWQNYIDNYGDMIDVPLSDIFAIKDPGANALNWFAAKFGLKVYAVNLVSAVPFVVGLVWFCRLQPLPWLAFAVAVPYLITVVAMGYTKQSVAIGFLLLAVVELAKLNQLRFVLLVLVGALFHQASLLMLPIGALASAGRATTKALAIIALFIIIVLTLLWSSYEQLWANYVVQEMASEGGAIRVWMSAVAAVIFLSVRRQWRTRWPDAPLWTWISLITFACIPLVGLASTAVDRMALYFIPLQLVVYSRLPALIGSRLARTTVVMGILLGYAAVLWVWLNYAIHAGYWLPYNNVTFLPLLN